jgi:hypothetical protein
MGELPIDNNFHARKIINILIFVCLIDALVRNQLKQIRKLYII